MNKSKPTKLRYWPEIVFYAQDASDWHKGWTASEQPTPFQHALDLAVEAGIESLVFLLPAEELEIKRHLRTLAVNYPVRVLTLNLNSNFSAWQNVADYHHLLSNELVVSPWLNWGFATMWQELQKFQAEVVLAVSDGKPQEKPWGYAALNHLYVKAVSRPLIKGFLPCLPPIKLTSSWFASTKEQIITESNLATTINEFAKHHVVKACHFSSPRGN